MFTPPKKEKKKVSYLMIMSSQKFSSNSQRTSTGQALNCSNSILSDSRAISQARKALLLTKLLKQPNESILHKIESTCQHPK